jgi:hypothetical protein
MSGVVRVGFTGTQHSGVVTDVRLRKLRDKLRRLRRNGADEFHHGDCLGMDAIAAELARLVGYRLVAYPGHIVRARANTKADVRHPPKYTLDRNHDIVDAVQLMLAVPEDPERELWGRAGGGTWATVHYAQKVGRKVVLL